MRVAFVGQRTFFEACAMPDAIVDGFVTRFVDFRAGADAGGLLRALQAFEPDAVIVFRPEVLPAGVLQDVRAPVLGFLTEPIPRESAGGAARHEDLERRLWELEQVDPDNVDRVVTFDPLTKSTADRVLPVWRSLALPVSDRYYRDVTPRTGPPRAVFVGRSTTHRERLLRDVKHHQDVLHLGFGVDADYLEELMDAHDTTINVHNEPYPSFENRVCLHLAAGHLVLSEPLSPTHGLEPGSDYVEFRDARQLYEAIEAMRRVPGLWFDVRVRGRQKAELFRASRVWPRLIADMQADIAASGSRRSR